MDRRGRSRDGHIPAFAKVSPPAYWRDHRWNEERTKEIFVKIHQSRNPVRIKDEKNANTSIEILSSRSEARAQRQM